MERNLKFLIAALFILFIMFFIPFWEAISLALIFSLLLFPLLYKLDKHHRVKGKLAIAAVIVTTLMLLLPFSLGFYAATSRVLTLAKESRGQAEVSVLETENLKKGLIQKIKDYGKRNQVYVSKETIDSVDKITSNIEEKIVDSSKNILLSIPEFSVHLLIFTLAFYIFLRYGTKVKNLILNLNLLKEGNLNELINVSQEACYQTVISLIIVGTVQATVVLGGAWFAGFSELLLIFSLTFIFSFIPVIGAGPVALVLSLMKFIDGDWKMGFLLLVVSIIAGTIDNLLKPIFLKRSTNMDSAISLISIIGAIVVLGIAGLFIGPVIGYISVYYFNKLNTISRG